MDSHPTSAYDLSPTFTSGAFGLDCHPYDFAHEINGQMAALAAVQSNVRHSELSEGNRGALAGLLSRLAWLQGDVLKAAMARPD